MMERNYLAKSSYEPRIEGGVRKGVSLSRVAGIAATVTIILCVLLTLASQIVHPGYNPLHDAISVLVWGPYGWLQTASFYLLAFSVVVLGAGLFFKADTSARFKIGVIMLILMGIGTIVVSLHPTDIPGSPETTTGIIHTNAAAALVFLLPLACFLMAPHMKKAFSQRWIGRYTYFAGFASVALIAAIAVMVLGNHGFLGAMERLIMANGLMWVQVMNIHII
jgi:hypothetical protein